MLKRFLLLIALAVVWVLLLWFVLPFNAVTLSYAQLVLTHLLPPCIVWGGCLFAQRIMRRRKEREKKTREAEAEAKRMEMREAARKKHEEELVQRRFGCDCRAVAITGITGSGEGVLMADIASTLDAASEEEDKHSALALDSKELQCLSMHIRNALAAIYKQSSAALALPIYIVPPPQAAAGEAISLVRRIVHEIGKTQEPPISLHEDAPRIVFAPRADSAADRAIAIFENTPDLPGAILLAFDAPAARHLASLHTLESADQREAAKAEAVHQEKWLGKPNQAVVAMLLTHPEFDAMLTSIAGYSPDIDDSMRPFWERGIKPGPHLKSLARMELTARDALVALPIQARIHRAAFHPVKEEPRASDMSSLCMTLMERSLVAAGLLTPAFSLDAVAATPENSQAKSKQKQSQMTRGWLIHNAGRSERSGDRLAALATALRYFSFDVHPLDEATDIAAKVGYLGEAMPWAMLGESVVRANDCSQAVLCTEFQWQTGIVLSYAIPARLLGKLENPPST